MDPDEPVQLAYVLQGEGPVFNRDGDLAILEQVEAELADVEHALRRLDDGTYGTCEACGRAIEEGRLESMPGARFCLEDEGRPD